MYVGETVISTVCVIVDKVLNTHMITCSTELKGKRALDDNDGAKANCRRNAIVAAKIMCSQATFINQLLAYHNASSTDADITYESSE